MPRARGVSDHSPTVVVEWSGAIITNRHGELLLNLRGPDKMLYPGMWDLVGGTLEAGETAEACLVREVFEETGESLKSFEWLQDFDVPLTEVNCGRLHLFWAEVDKAASALLLGEGQEHRFFRAADLSEIKIAPGTDQALLAFLDSDRYRATYLR